MFIGKKVCYNKKDNCSLTDRHNIYIKYSRKRERYYMQIYDMKVNHLTNPLGFRMPRTVFFLEGEGSGRQKTGGGQTAGCGG